MAQIAVMAQTAVRTRIDGMTLIAVMAQLGVRTRWPGSP